MLKIEDIEDYEIAAEVAKRVRNGQERVYSAQETRRELGLDDKGVRGAESQETDP